MATRTQENDAAPPIAGRIRTLREARGMSLRDLAVRSGVSPAMLSQVERAATSPTLAVAQKIAAGLGLSLSQLLRLDEGRHVAVVRLAQRRSVRAAGHRYDIVTPELPGQRATVTVHTLRAGARTSAPRATPLHEPGSRETLLVTSGEIALRLDGQRYDLSEGDAVTFDADLTHDIANPGAREAAFVAVVTAGLRTT